MRKQRKITESDRLKKNALIKSSLKATRDKRESQCALVFMFKIDKSKMNDKQAEELFMLFVQSKWMKNYLIGETKKENSEIDIFKYEFKDTVIHKDKDMNDVVSELHMGSQIKQSVVQSIRNDIKSLSALKSKGNKIGGLKFVTDYNSIDLKQYGTTYQIIPTQNKNLGKLKIQGIKKPFRIHGMDQLNKLKDMGLEYEFANAKLLKDSVDDYYIAVTVYIDKAKYIEIKKKNIKREIDSYDLGCSNTVTRSDGYKCKCDVREPERLKFLQRELEKHTKRSKRHTEIRRQINKQYIHMSNKKDDAANKIVKQILEAETVVIQDEQIVSWQENEHGKTVTHSCLGRIKQRLEREAKTSGRVVILNKWLPTTKLCTCCGQRLDLSLSDRKFVCECGSHGDRDAHAAQNMLWFYRHGIRVGKSNDIEYEDLNKLIDAAIAADKQNVESIQENIASGKSGTDSTLKNTRNESQDSEREAATALASR